MIFRHLGMIILNTKGFNDGEFMNGRASHVTYEDHLNKNLIESLLPKLKVIVESHMITSHPNDIDNVRIGGLNNDIDLRNPIPVTNIQNTRDGRYNRNFYHIKKSMPNMQSKRTEKEEVLR